MKNIYKSENSVIFQNRFYDHNTGELLSPIETQNYVIIQVAESYYNNSFMLESHLQYCDIEITFPLTNGLNCSADGAFEKVNKHEIYISLKGEKHALKSRRSCRFQTVAINFKNGPCFDMLKSIKEKAAKQRTFYVSGISDCLAAVVAEFMSLDTPFSVNNLDSLITFVLVKLTRCGMEKPMVDILSQEEKLPAIINYIDAHFLQICSLEELSLHFGYTYSHICKIFKKTYGITPSDYLISKKIELSKTLLKQGKNLSEIAELLGYSTSYNFSRAFRQKTGISPSTYKKQKTKVVY